MKIFGLRRRNCTGERSPEMLQVCHDYPQTVVAETVGPRIFRYAPQSGSVPQTDRIRAKRGEFDG